MGEFLCFSAHIDNGYIHASRFQSRKAICTAAGPTYKKAIYTTAVFNAKMLYTRLLGLHMEMAIYTTAVFKEKRCIHGCSAKI